MTLALTALAAEDCVKTCEASAADKLGCDIDDLDGCFCKDDFVTQAKTCAADCDDDKTGVQSYFKDYYASCTAKSPPDLATKTDAVAKSSAAAAKATSTDTSDCVKECEEEAADKLGCKISDLEGCFCKDDFSVYAKDCASDCGDKTGPQEFFKDYYASCTNKSPPNLATKSSGSLNTGAKATATSTGAESTSTDSDSSAMSLANMNGVLRVVSGVCAMALLLNLAI
ncbi:hypothetical protein ACHAPJ_009332 [Fusarium lateritium]